MKRISKLMMGLSIPISTLSFLPLVSCGDKALNVTITHGEHIQVIEQQEKAYLNKEFKIKCYFNNGWRRINTSTSYIEVGGEKLIVDRHYGVYDDTIWVYSNVIKSDNIKVHIEVEATTTDLDGDWSESSSIIHSNYSLYAKPGDKFSTKDMVVKATVGDGEIVTASCGHNNGQYQIYLNEEDITDSFAAGGYTFTTDDAESGPNLMDFAFVYKDSGDYSVTLTLLVFCGNAPTSLTIQNTDKAIKVGEKALLICKANEGAYDYCNFEIVKDSSTTATDATIETDVLGNIYLKAGEKTGNVKVKATSKFNTVTTATGTFKIE